jgi:LysM repeat protein
MSNYKIPTSDSFNSPMPRLRPTGLASRNDMKPEEPEQGPLERFFSLFRSSGGESKPAENRSSSSRAMKFYDASNNRDTKPSGNISSSPMRIGKARAELDLFEELDVVAPGVITVASGDTLSAIARDNNTTVAEIQKANPTITNVNQINVGQDINIPSASKIKAKPSGIMTKPTSNLFAKVSKGYKSSNIKSYSYYNKPIVFKEGGLRGNSRIAGDASEEIQRRSMEAIVEQGIASGMTDRQIGLTLAIARHESGFNPDAAAGTSSASGLGQFINNTGKAYGITDETRWDIGIQAKALVEHTLDNIKLANKRKKGEEYVYKYHHDGPTKDYGGLKTGRMGVSPFINRYAQFAKNFRKTP